MAACGAVSDITKFEGRGRGKACVVTVVERKLGHQLRQRGPGVEQGSLADNLAGGIHRADMMRAVAKIKAEGEPAGSNGCG